MSKMGELYHDIQRAEALMDQEQAIKNRIYEAFSRTVEQLLKRNEQLEAALIQITQTAPFGRPQDIARAALSQEKKDG